MRFTDWVSSAALISSCAPFIVRSQMNTHHVVSGNFTDSCGCGTSESASKQTSNEIVNGDTSSKSRAQGRGEVATKGLPATTSTNKHGAHLSGRRYVMNEPSERKEIMSMKNAPLPSGLSVEGSDTELETATEYSYGSMK